MAVSPLTPSLTTPRNPFYPPYTPSEDYLLPTYEHRGQRPQVHPSATIAPTAVISGDVRIGADVRVLHGAVLTAEDGVITIDDQSVVMENALVRARKGRPVSVGRDVLIGPHVHLNGATVGDGCFLGTGAALFPGATLAEGVEVRIHGVVHVNTHLDAGAMVPIGWVAVGAPASILPPDQHEAIWAVQEGLDFPGTVYGVPRGTPARVTMARQSQWYAAHSSDRLIDGAEDADVAR